MEEPISQEKKQQEQSWIEHLQKNSWEPEVIISGISLAFLFAIPSQLFKYAVISIQDYGLEQIPASLALAYFSLIISVFKIFLVSHLFLRFMWAGMLGITYAFPDGVIKNRLFKISQDMDYPHPNQYLIKLEYWCSVSYGFPLSMIIPLAGITLYLVLLLSISLVFNLEFQVIYVIFMVTLLIFVVMTLTKSNKKLRNFIGKSLSGTIGAVYQSNLGKWTTSIFSLVLLVLALPLINSDMKGFSYFQNEVNLSDEQYDWPDESNYFESYNSDGERFPRVWSESKAVSGDRMYLYLAHYASDSKKFPRLQELIEGDYDTLAWAKPEKIPDLYRIYLDDSLISPSKWSPITSGFTGQKAWLTSMDLTQLAPGVHEIRVEKLIYNFPFLVIEDGLRHRKRWARFEFVKE